MMLTLGIIEAIFILLSLTCIIVTVKTYKRIKIWIFLKDFVQGLTSIWRLPSMHRPSST